MKKIFLLFSFVFAATLISCGPTTDDAIKHNDKIVADQKKMLELESNFVNSIIDNAKISIIENNYGKYIDFLKETEQKYADMKSFDDKDTFRKAMIDLVGTFKKVAENEYKEMLDIFKKDIDELSEKDFNRWEELTNIIDEKEGKANNAFLDAQKEFAKEYKFELQ
jgi:hypothetical protein